MLRWIAPFVAAAVLLAPGTAQASDVVSFSHDSFVPAARLLASTVEFWGGTYIVPTGEQVTVFTSDSYPEDPAANQQLANFLARAVHGPEIETVRIYRVTETEINELCGRNALACYDLDQRAIVTPAETGSFTVSAESALLHEYGHHVASARNNNPWAAIDWGTKRWATYENVCARTRSGAVVPGAEDPRNYHLNPGEGFAEAYRVLNERRLGLAEAPWQAVDFSFFPDARALSLLQQDVERPWTSRTTTSINGRLGKGRSRTYRIATPLDGNLTVRGPGGLRFEVLGPRVRLRAGTGAVTTEVCGQRSLRVRVTARRALTYRFSVTKP